MHLLRGKQVLELTVISTDKGRAVESLRKQYHATAVLYVGDDITDENAFSALRPGDLGRQGRRRRDRRRRAGGRSRVRSPTC